MRWLRHFVFRAGFSCSKILQDHDKRLSSSLDSKVPRWWYWHPPSRATTRYKSSRTRLSNRAWRVVCKLTFAITEHTRFRASSQLATYCVKPLIAEPRGKLQRNKMKVAVLKRSTRMQVLDNRAAARYSRKTPMKMLLSGLSLIQ